jgi:hypothetical protein
VHAVAGGLGDPGRFFHEGLAVALGDEGRWDGRAVDALVRALAATVDRKQLVKSFDSLPSARRVPRRGLVREAPDRPGGAAQADRVLPRLSEGSERGRRLPADVRPSFQAAFARMAAADGRVSAEFPMRRELFPEAWEGPGFRLTP